MANPISISRVQPSYKAGGTAVITFTVINHQPPTLAPDIPETATITDTAQILAKVDIARDPNTIRAVAVVDTLTAGEFLSAPPPDREADTVVWNLFDIPPQVDRAFSVTLQLPATAATFSPALGAPASVRSTRFPMTR